MKRFVVMLVAFGLVASLVTAPAAAFPQFAKEFKKIYAGEESTPVEAKIAASLAKVKCNVCHDPKKGPDGKASKKNRNAYGNALSKLITKEDKKDVEKIHKALKTVESQKPEGGDQSYGERLKAGLLPVDPPPAPAAE